VEEFRLPVFKGSIGVRDQKTGALVAATEAPLAVQIEYVSGGPASNLPVQVSALMKDTSPPFASQFESFSFAPYKKPADNGASAPATEGDDDNSSAQEDTSTSKLVADKTALTLDRNGTGTLTLKSLPVVEAPKRIALEATFADPNGEIQTLRGDATLWPAAVAAGIKAGDWVSVGNAVPVQALAVDLQGKPRAGVALEIRGVARTMTSSRKRMVGGFYAYDNHTETKDLGTLCSGKSDDHGLLSCDAKLKEAIAQLPDQKEIPDLLSTVSSLGRESGLEILLFRQKAEVLQDFYAEVPVEMLMKGTYAQFTEFFNRVGKLNRIVNVKDISMKTPLVSEGRVVLSTSCTAVTFRFLSEADVFEFEHWPLERRKVDEQDEKENQCHYTCHPADRMRQRRVFGRHTPAQERNAGNSTEENGGDLPPRENPGGRA